MLTRTYTLFSPQLQLTKPHVHPLPPRIQFIYHQVGMPSLSYPFHDSTEPVGQLGSKQPNFEKKGGRGEMASVKKDPRSKSI